MASLKKMDRLLNQSLADVLSSSSEEEVSSSSEEAGPTPQKFTNGHRRATSTGSSLLDNSFSMFSTSSAPMDEDDEDFTDHDDGTHPVQKSAGKARVNEIAEQDSLKVRIWKIVVLAVLATIGFILSVSTYIVLRKQENEDKQRTFELTVSAMQDTFQFQADSVRQALGSLGSQMTVHTIEANETFPGVTVPYFSIYGEEVGARSLIDTIVLTPLLSDDQRSFWYDYSHANYLKWMPNATDTVAPFIFDRTGNVIVASPRPGPYAPVWQTWPVPSNPDNVNFNLMSSLDVQMAVEALLMTNQMALTGVINTDELLRNTDPSTWEVDAPTALAVQPIHETLSNASGIVALVIGVLRLDDLFSDMLPNDFNGLIGVLENSDGQAYAYEMNGNEVTRVSSDKFNAANCGGLSSSVQLFTNDTTAGVTYTVRICASTSYQSAHASVSPVVFSIVVAIGFLLCIIAFLLYDRIVQQRNAKIVNAASRTAAIVSSLFPTNVHERLFGGDGKKGKKLAKAAKVPNSAIKSMLDQEKADILMDMLSERGNDDDDDEEIFKTKPIADLFPSTTVLFADIAGFTAWSSSREPSQVFILLETVYRAFDLIAKQRGVFKVETVGDCYVAVCGLPQPRKDHAIVMARFARDCMRKMDQLTKKLEVTLGPDTADLCMRMGLHSGPVTGGVLRGEGSRFQLFGDTMNTASRAETTGEKGRIQISQATADQLIAGGKSKWFKPREEKVYAKGKGELQTYWLKTGKHHRTVKKDNLDDDESDDGDYSDSESEEYTESCFEDDLVLDLVSEKTSRLIDWNVDCLIRLLKQIEAKRRANFIMATQSMPNPSIWRKYKRSSKKVSTILDEVTEIIALPEFDENYQAVMSEADSIELDPVVIAQLRDFVTNTAIMYRDSNAFHNFEHASHVMMSVIKFMSRIVAPSDVGASNKMALHDHTYGITSSPLTQFACAFAALVHDVDHPGVPNAQLVKEGTHMARAYKGKSIAEHNSIDISWDLLMDDSYAALRNAICTTPAEAKRFRQLLVNTVMATDIIDKDLKNHRDARWDRAFAESAPDSNDRDMVNRKATIVIEHLLQASDVSHTMQHWQVYRKWNERFFEECSKAYLAGRAERNPQDYWYDYELQFFDFYIIPLARKLKECGAFGVSSEEGLDYATKNRQEWEARGREIVKEMVDRFAVLSTRRSSFNGNGLLERSSHHVPMRKPPLGTSAAALPAAPRVSNTFAIGSNQVTKTSVSSALSILMQQVQQMEYTEQVIASRAPSPLVSRSPSPVDPQMEISAKDYFQ